MNLYRSRLGHSGSSGTKVYIDGQQSEARRIYLDELIPLHSLPNPVQYSSRMRALVYNNEIHLLGENDANGYASKSHYKWNGVSWVSVSTLPIYLYGNACVFEDKIHIIGGSSSQSYDAQKHYSWDGNQWIEERYYPVSFYSGTHLIVFNGYLYGFCNKGDAYYDGEKWTYISSAPNGDPNCLTVYQGAIHCFGMVKSNNKSSRYHYKWNGSNWISVSTLPFDCYKGVALTYNDKIHVFTGYCSNYSTDITHYSWDGSSWKEESQQCSVNGSEGIIYNGKMMLMGEYASFIEPIDCIKEFSVT